MASSEYFRAGVGLVVIDERGRVLALERSDVRGSWQLPQGGADPGEKPIDAARRELREETGIDASSIEFLAEHPCWLGYELPAGHRNSKTGRGQVHRWFLVRFRGDDSEIDLRSDDGDPEFCEWRWTTLAELAAVTWPVRRPVYDELAARWSEHLA